MYISSEAVVHARAFVKVSNFINHFSIGNGKMPGNGNSKINQRNTLHFVPVELKSAERVDLERQHRQGKDQADPEAAAKYIGMALANLVVVLDPEVVVLGGAITDDLLLEASRTEMARHLPPGAVEGVTVVPATLGDAAAAVGAARAAMLAAR